MRPALLRLVGAILALAAGGEHARERGREDASDRRGERRDRDVVGSVPVTMVGAKMLATATASQMPTTATVKPSHNERLAPGVRLPNAIRTSPVARAAYSQSANDAIARWSCCVPVIMSGDQMLATATATQMLATLIPAKRYRPSGRATRAGWVDPVTSTCDSLVRVCMTSPPDPMVLGRRPNRPGPSARGWRDLLRQPERSGSRYGSPVRVAITVEPA